MHMAILAALLALSIQANAKEEAVDWSDSILRVSGAGSSAVDGIYKPGERWGGNPLWNQNGDTSQMQIWYNGEWRMGVTSKYWYVNSEATQHEGPLQGKWRRGDYGLSPIPTLSMVSGITWKTGSTRVSCTQTCGTDKCSESAWPRSSNDMRKIAASAGVHCPNVRGGGWKLNPVLQDGTCYWDASYSGRRCGLTNHLEPYTKFCPCIKQVTPPPTPAPTPHPTPAPTLTPTPAPTTAPKQCATGPKQCSHLASFSLLDSVVAFRNDQEAQTCMNSGMDAVARQVANTCTIKQVQGSIPCGTECWPVLKPKVLSVQSRCLEKKYSGLEKYNTCLLEHGCERPSAEQCRDTDHGYTDSGNDPCYRYHGHESWCGHYDTSYFHSHSMCCACGGGGWACPDQSATDVMKVQGAAYIMEGYLSNISLQLSQTAPESPIPMTHANHEALSLTLAFIGGALAAIMLGFIALRRLKGKRSSAAGHLLA